MTDPLSLSHVLRVTALVGRKSTRFDLSPDAAQRERLARLLGITAVHNLHFRGEIGPMSRADLMLEARLQATVVQPCIVTLAPVTTRIDESVVRKYLGDYRPAEDDEAEMPADDSIEPLPVAIDVAAVMAEALALALPDYPRAPGAVLDETVHAASGVAPLRDADLKPFAGLAGLAKKLSGTEPDDTDG